MKGAWASESDRQKQRAGWLSIGLEGRGGGGAFEELFFTGTTKTERGAFQARFTPHNITSDHTQGRQPTQMKAQTSKSFSPRRGGTGAEGIRGKAYGSDSPEKQQPKRQKCDFYQTCSSWWKFLLCFFSMWTMNINLKCQNIQTSTFGFLTLTSCSAFHYRLQYHVVYVTFQEQIF